MRPTADCADRSNGLRGLPVGLPSRGLEDVAQAAFPSAMNNQLRTGADKGNPTV